jgi:hypothetical protein
MDVTSLLVDADGDALPAFGAAKTQNVAAAGGGHASKKAVRAQTTLVVRLESPFHGKILTSLGWRP